MSRIKNLNSLKKLLQKDGKSSLRKIHGKDGASFIHTFAKNGNVENVKWILEQDKSLANFTGKTKGEQTPLFFMCKKDFGTLSNFENLLLCVDELLKSGADANANCKVHLYGELKVLEYAILNYQSPAILKRLIEGGATVTPKTLIYTLLENQKQLFYILFEKACSMGISFDWNEIVEVYNNSQRYTEKMENGKIVFCNARARTVKTTILLSALRYCTDFRYIGDPDKDDYSESECIEENSIIRDLVSHCNVDLCEAETQNSSLLSPIQYAFSNYCWNKPSSEQLFFVENLLLYILRKSNGILIAGKDLKYDYLYNSIALGSVRVFTYIIDNILKKTDDWSIEAFNSYRNSHSGWKLVEIAACNNNVSVLKYIISEIPGIEFNDSHDKKRLFLYFAEPLLNPLRRTFPYEIDDVIYAFNVFVEMFSIDINERISTKKDSTIKSTLLIQLVKTIVTSADWCIKDIELKFLVYMLTLKNLDINATEDLTEKTALDYACEHESTYIVSLLLMAGASVTDSSKEQIKKDTRRNKEYGALFQYVEHVNNQKRKRQTENITNRKMIKTSLPDHS